jgi:ATP-dependent DNA ligase
LKARPVSGVILDGEAVAHCEKGLPDFHGLLGDGAASASGAAGGGHPHRDEH